MGPWSSTRAADGINKVQAGTRTSSLKTRAFSRDPLLRHGEGLADKSRLTHQQHSISNPPQNDPHRCEWLRQILTDLVDRQIFYHPLWRRWYILRVVRCQSRNQSYRQPCTDFFPPETTTHETSNKCYIVWNEKQIMYINFWKLNTYGRNMLENIEYSRECR